MVDVIQVQDQTGHDEHWSRDGDSRSGILSDEECYRFAVPIAPIDVAPGPHQYAPHLPGQ